MGSFDIPQGAISKQMSKIPVGDIGLEGLDLATFPRVNESMLSMLCWFDIYIWGWKSEYIHETNVHMNQTNCVIKYHNVYDIDLFESILGNYE